MEDICNLGDVASEAVAEATSVGRGDEKAESLLHDGVVAVEGVVTMVRGYHAGDSLLR